ncbi:MAG: TIM barrel protein [Candidatus Hydrogenedentes bacterium]|nr:TIM barrel protein [Candidatus Hydrogenedentota bacterium]
MTHQITRRTVLSTLAAGAAGAALSASATAQDTPAVPLNGRLKQSVCKWCYDKIPLDEFAQKAKGIGLLSVELLGEADWPVVKQHGLTCAMANGPSGIKDGWNLPADHDKLVKESERLLPLVAEAGLPNMIVFSGNRRGMDDMEGLKNCAVGLKRIMPLAEKLGVTVCMELLNSKRNHKDYMCDRTPWGANLCQEIGSERFKLLYDIYHMQIMEGDVIATIQENHQYIGHYHTGGVPGRAEIDETQELNYRRICEAIVETGFTGYLAQEFIPKREDPLASLAQGVQICDV